MRIKLPKRPGAPLSIWRLIRMNLKYLGVVLCIPPVVLLTVIYVNQIHTERERMVAQSQRIASLCAASMDAQLGSVYAGSLNVIFGEDARKITQTRMDLRESRYRMLLSNLQSALLRIAQENRFVNEPLLYYPEANLFITENSAYHNYWLDLSVMYDIWIGPLVSRVVPYASDAHADGDYFFADQTGFYYVNRRLDTVGALIAFRIDAKLAYNALTVVERVNARLVVLSPEGDVFFDSEAGALPDCAFRAAPDGTTRVAYDAPHTYSVTALSSSNERLPLTYVLITDEVGYRGLILTSIRTCAFVMLLCIAIMFTLAYFLSVKMSRPYQLIYDMLNAQATGMELPEQSNKLVRNELGTISHLISQNRREQSELYNRLLSREAMLTESQRIALQSQINPHILFNSLEAINWLVIEKLPEEREISGIVTRLSALLRLTLDVGRPVVSLREELRYVKAYMELQSMLSLGSFRHSLSFGEAYLDNCCVYLSLQPLIENAISHGVKMLESGGCIEIGCHESNGELHVTVTDNGPGFDERSLRALREHMNSADWKQNGHIGLVNVHKRIQLSFGEKFGLFIESEPGRTVVGMRLPRLKIGDYTDAFAMGARPDALPAPGGER